MNEVDRWLGSGAGAREGLRLLSKYTPNGTIERLVTANQERFGFLLIRALKPFGSGGMKEVSSRSVRKFREEWPFLSSPDCPIELKILASDKITAYHNYVSAHSALASCTTLEECFETAKKVIENYKQNRKILSEFAYFREHGSCLGKHPIFSETRRMEEIRGLNVMELLRLKKNLEGAIWRAKDEIKKGTKPHLDGVRQCRIESKIRQLREVERLIEKYESELY